MSMRRAPEEKAQDLRAAFDALRPILAEYESQLVVVHDRPDSYYLDTKKTNPKNKRPIFFGALRLKTYVSFHLMPVYVFPDLLQGMSEALNKRMHGKSCFNFKSVEAELFEELRALTRAGLARYEGEGML